jgi:hypothetical protein
MIAASHEAAVAEQILDGDDVRIGVEHLRGYGVPQLEQSLPSFWIDLLSRCFLQLSVQKIYY